MQLTDVIKAIKARWEVIFPDDPFYLQLAPGGPNGPKPPYVVFRFGQVTQNEPTSEENDWVMFGVFNVFDTDDVQVVLDADLVVDAFNRQTDMVGPAGTAIYSSLVHAADIDVNYTDQGALWSVAVTVEFRWSSTAKEIVRHAN